MISAVKNVSSNSDRINELVAKNMGLVYRVYNNLPQGTKVLYDYDDIISAGQLGLFKAVKSFDSGKSKFSTYAVHIIKNEIFMLFRSHQRLKDVPRNLVSSLEQVVSSDIDNTLLIKDTIPASDELAHNELLFDIQAFLSGLPDNHKLVFRGMMEQENQEDIANKLGVSQCHISRIIKKLRTKFKEYYYG